MALSGYFVLLVYLCITAFDFVFFWTLCVCVSVSFFCFLVLFCFKFWLIWAFACLLPCFLKRDEGPGVGEVQSCGGSGRRWGGGNCGQDILHGKIIFNSKYSHKTDLIFFKACIVLGTLSGRF